MSHARIPSAVELMRLPAGDRALRLRWLARWHQERAAAPDAAGSKNGATRHRNSLRKAKAVAGACGVQDIVT